MSKKWPGIPDTHADAPRIDVLVVDADRDRRRLLWVELNNEALRVIAMDTAAELQRLDPNALPRLVIANVDIAEGLDVASMLAKFGDKAPALLLVTDAQAPGSYPGITRFIPRGDLSVVVAATKTIFAS